MLGRKNINNCNWYLLYFIYFDFEIKKEFVTKEEQGLSVERISGLHNFCHLGIRSNGFT